MFRAGGLVVGEAPAGQNQVTVEVPSRVRFRPGDAIRLVHAPKLAEFEPFPSFHTEDAVIAPRGVKRVDQGQYLLTLTAPLVNTYAQDPLDPLLANGLSDGVGILSEGFYERNEAFINSGFGPAFVEYMDAPQEVRDIPYVPVISQEMHLANKWFENSGRIGEIRPGESNVRHVLAGTGLLDRTTRRVQINNSRIGLTWGSLGAPIPLPNASWTFVQAIENSVGNHRSPFSGLDPWIVNGENCVHELAHTWRVNYEIFGDNPGHCTENMTGSLAHMACTMNLASYPGYGDGIVGFHWVSDDDSEYMTIRKAPEPLPAP